MQLFQTICDDRRVANLQPTTYAPYRIAIIGEAPGKDEADAGTPFVGASGRFLTALLAQAGINRSSCFIGNICQYRPPDNDITKLDRYGDEFIHGMDALKADLAEFKPNICILLGRTALWAATKEDRSIDDWRGSLFISNETSSPFFGLKCISTYHPAAAMRMYDYTQYIKFDLIRAKQEAMSPELHLPQRTTIIAKSCSDIEQYIAPILRDNMPIATDIEGGIQCLTCISFASSAHDCIVIPFTHGDGSRYWSFEDECRVWQLIDSILGNPSIPKILQNSLYDMFVLAWNHKILIRGIRDDTMLKWWELFSEMEKSLAVQVSILTREPYYKAERKSGDMETYWRYNGKDSMCTYECNAAMENQLIDDPTQRVYAKWHYRFNMALLYPLLYMQLEGIPYDAQEAKKMRERYQQKAYILQWYINKSAGYNWPPDNSDRLRDLVNSICLTKRGDRPLKEFADTYAELMSLACRPSLTCAQRGYMQSTIGFGLNVDSTKQLSEFLYNKLGYDKQYKKERGRKTDKTSVDILSLLNIYKTSRTKLLSAIIRLGTILTSISNLSHRCDSDGRVRCAYNLVGTETGRISCYESPTGSGYNLQTVTKKQRKLFRADKDSVFFNCDLSGADGWTVAAWCAAAGDRTMLDDYYFGLKPARNTALMYLHGPEMNHKTREDLKKLGKTISGDGWLYFSCKCVQHGTNYGMFEKTIVDIIVKNSYKFNDGAVIYIELPTARQLRSLYLIRYGAIHRWASVISNFIKNRGWVVSASGHRRIVMGRRDDDATLRAILANEPQENTTFATNLALYRLWTDPENRESDGSLKIKPRHQVHDALNGVWHKRYDNNWASEKIRSYFNNTINIAGIPIVIPFEGAYGPSWGECKQPI